ncbi:MAG: hypothetical protein ABUS51_05265 [Acidobacteriota bacterium]
MKEIIAQFSAESSRALRRGETAPETTEILEALRDAGALIEPLHAGSDDPRLSRYFVIRVADDAKADDLARRLRSLKPTDAAYIKPHEEAPESRF